MHINVIKWNVGDYTRIKKFVPIFLSYVRRVLHPTRWNSIFLMLQVALQYKDGFQRLEQRNNIYKQKPTQSNREWESAKMVCSLLDPLYNATNLFSVPTYPTTNFLFDEICEIRTLLEVKRDGVLARIGDSMLEKLMKYWNICHLPVACTVF